MCRVDVFIPGRKAHLRPRLYLPRTGAIALASPTVPLAYAQLLPGMVSLSPQEHEPAFGRLIDRHAPDEVPWRQYVASIVSPVPR
jgi:hypothetical protein